MTTSLLTFLPVVLVLVLVPGVNNLVVLRRSTPGHAVVRRPRSVRAPAS